MSLSTVVAASRAAAASRGARSGVAASLSALPVSSAFAAAPASGCLALGLKVNPFADACEVKAPLGRRRRDCRRRSGVGLFDFRRALGKKGFFRLCLGPQLLEYDPAFPGL